MSEKQKQFVTQKIIEASNFGERLGATWAASRNILRRKYNSLSGDQFEKIWIEVGPDWYLSELAKMYCQQFTLEELNQILSFWLSKPGQKLVRGSFVNAEIQLGLTWSLEIESACRNALKSRGNHENN